MLSTAEKQLILLNMCYHNEGLKKYFSRGYNMYRDIGLTKSLYDDKNTIDIVLRLMDNRNFDKMDDKTKREMFYTDYYPVEAKTDKGVYLDDRRNLCQALHNKICLGLQIPETIVKLVDFRKTDMDEDMFHFYNHKTGEIFINTGLDYSATGETELAEAVIRATFIYQLHNELKQNFKRIDELGGKHKYLLLSLLLKTYMVETFDAEGKDKKRDAIQYNDGFSSAYVYATFSTYEYLNRMFEKYNLTKLPQLETFNEGRLSYLEALTNLNVEEREDEEGETDEDVFFDPEDEEVSVEAEVNDEGCILDDTIDLDIDLLYDTEMSSINKMTEGEIFNIFKRELDESYKDFYDFFGYKTEFGFAEEFDNYKESVIALEETEEFEEE